MTSDLMYLRVKVISLILWEMLVKILLEIILIIKVNFNFSSTYLKREGFPKLIEVYEKYMRKEFLRTMRLIDSCIE